MSTHVSRYFRSIRQELGLRLPDVAQRLGYQNIAKGCNRVNYFEDRGTDPSNKIAELLAKLCEIYGVPEQTVFEQTELDRLAWERWADEPVPMSLVIKVMPAVYLQKSIPDEVTTQVDAERWACDLAQQMKMQTCLAVSRRLAVYFTPEGRRFEKVASFDDTNVAPYMQIGKRQFRLRAE